MDCSSDWNYTWYSIFFKDVEHNKKYIQRKKQDIVKMRVENTKWEMAKYLYSDNTTMNENVKLEMKDFNVKISQK